MSAVSVAVPVFTAGNYRYIKAVFQYSGGVAAEAGFEIERATYANWTFFTPILAGRTLMKLTGIKPESENNVNVSALNGVFGKLFGAERFWLKNFNFPFGVSIVIVARKK